MAKQISKWVANDGYEFTSQAAAEERDRLLVAVELAMRPLGPRYEFKCSGTGYVQHSAQAVEQAKLGLYELARKPLKWWIDAQKEKHGKTDTELALHVHVSWHCRMLDGSCPPVERAYCRIMCLDEQHREWDQPFFAANPDKRRDETCVEDRTRQEVAAQ